MNWSEMKILLTTMWYARMKCSDRQESLPRIDELIKFVSANDNPQCNWLLKVEPSCVYGEMHGTEQDEWRNWIHHSHKQLYTISHKINANTFASQPFISSPWPFLSFFESYMRKVLHSYQEKTAREHSEERRTAQKRPKIAREWFP